MCSQWSPTAVNARQISNGFLRLSTTRYILRNKRLFADERKRALVSLQHAKNLCGFLQKALGDLPDKRLVKHLDEFFLYVDTSIDSSLRLPLDNDLSEMRALIDDLHQGWQHLISPIRAVISDSETPMSHNA